ncbi:folylpolyglutamate synthase [Saxophila tyrrhenica]|uniref:Folylpolyglutamate synthase n=1 Tax=Saxophila tyrrhenica TaxID=1690608 RepID=A0AAV9PD73_9PEZI|nr:folylpolyglutamate synthase [Saxophila tyrrhenica]
MITPGLERITRLLARTPLPWRAIHVAGTNGKGSICAYISRMLDVYNNSLQRHRNADERPALRKHQRASGRMLIYERLRHARFTSPHLVDRWDCITIDGQTVPSKAFHDVEQRVLRRNDEEEVGASEFELLTATAFEIFTEHRVDVAVVETGMGGKLDATNIVGLQEGTEKPASLSWEEFRPLPLVTAISSIGLDHQAFLGGTLAEITRAKAGIFKDGVPAVYDHENPKEVKGILEDVARRICIPIRSLGHPEGSKDHLYAYEHLEEMLQLYPLPPHAKRNAAVALLATWTALQRLERPPCSTTTEDDVLLGKEWTTANAFIDSMLDVIPETTFPGRQQLIDLQDLTGRKQAVLLDGAHNAESAESLGRVVLRSRTHPDRPHVSQRVTWVLAASDTKDPKDILTPLLKDGDTVVAVEFGPVDGMPWVKPLNNERLLEAARSVVSDLESLNVHTAGKDVLAALRTASQMANGGPMVIAGSLYLVGDVLRLLRDAETV